jgi:hypothetical protein
VDESVMRNEMLKLIEHMVDEPLPGQAELLARLTQQVDPERWEIFSNYNISAVDSFIYDLEILYVLLMGE